MESLLAGLKKGKVLVSDGAWGTQLFDRGLKPGECPEYWNITHRQDVLNIARGYTEAGADIILTNSFGANPVKLAHYELADMTVDLNKTAAIISREAAGNDHFVLGSMGPTGVILSMEEDREDEIFNGFSIQAKALAEGGADALCIETMQDPVEAALAIRAARKSTDCEIACTFTFNRSKLGEYRTMMGLTIAEAVKISKEARADIIVSNCGNGMEGMVDIVREIRKVDKTTPVLIHANAGLPVLKEGTTIFPETPDHMAARALDVIAAGANIVGGCCGTTMDHIRALANTIKGR